MAEADAPIAARVWPLRLIATFIVLIGLLLGGGGLVLVFAGGSLYYLAAGAALIAAAVLLWIRDSRGAAIYGGFLIATLVWSFWEVGLDGWALMPRLIGPALVGLALVAPFARRPLRPSGGLAVSTLASGAAMIALVYLWIASAALLHDEGPRSNYSASVQPTSQDGEWQAYGNTAGGTRFSPLTQITPQNVDKLTRVWTYRTGVSPVSP